MPIPTRTGSLAPILLPILLTALACAPAELAQMSAEPTSCAAEQIQISDARQPMEGPSSWTASCMGPDGAVQKKWFCSKMHQQVICTEDPR